MVHFSSRVQPWRGTKGRPPSQKARRPPLDQPAVSRSVTTVSRIWRILKADEITRADPDELFVLFRGFPHPIRCFAAPYFRYPNIALAMNESRFVRVAG
jgi:type IV secretory pathway TraG/TraD family ATPase VirD4